MCYKFSPGKLVRLSDICQILINSFCITLCVLFTSFLLKVVLLSHISYSDFLCVPKKKIRNFQMLTTRKFLLNFGEVSYQFAKCSINHVVTFLVCQYVILQYQFWKGCVILFVNIYEFIFVNIYISIVVIESSNSAI